jgi:uncharacterized membrane protein YeaQ/YmgE (transglycosylase-associated protein family)
MGLIVAALAKLIMPGKDPGGFIITILLGVAGGFLGGWVGSKLGIGTVDAFNLKSVLIATGGSIIILIIYRLLFRKKEA